MRCLLVALLLAAAPVLATEPAQADYMLNCQGCHLPEAVVFPSARCRICASRWGAF